MKKNTTLHSRFLKFKSRLDRSIQNGTFSRFTFQKRQTLIKRLDRFKRQLANLNTGWKVGAAMAMSSFALTPNLHAQTSAKAGTNFSIDTSSRTNSAVAADSAGNFVIAWEESYSSALKIQLYNADGTSKGNSTTVSAASSGTTFSNPTVSMDNDGDFVVAWQTNEDNNGDDFGDKIVAQRFSSSGNVKGNRFNVSNQSLNHINPSVSMDADGDFVVAWESDSFDKIYAKRYNANGVSQGELIKAGTGFDGERNPSVSLDDDGDFVIAWQDLKKDETTYDIFAQRYNNTGVIQGEEIEVTPNNSSNNTTPSVSLDSDGDFVIAWKRGYEQINAQRYNNEGVAQGEINTISYGSDPLKQPSVAMDSEGGFVIALEGYRDIFAKRYSPEGTSLTSTFKINENTSFKNRYNPSLAIDSDGDYIITWYDEENGIYAQRYSPERAPVISPITNQEVEENTGITLTVLATDANEDEISFSLDPTSLDLGMKIDETSGEFNWTPTTNNVGSHEVKIFASDEELKDSITFTIEVKEQSVQALSEALKSQITIYPNPASNQLRLSVGTITDAQSYSVLDFSGREVDSGTLLNKETSISVEELPVGVYHVEIIGTDWTKTQKFIKQD